MNLKELINESILSISEHLNKFSKYLGLFYNATNGIIKDPILRLEINDKPEITLTYGGKITGAYDEEKIKEKLKTEFKNFKIKKCECFVGSSKTMICNVVLSATNEIKKNKLFFKIENANLGLYHVDASERYIIVNNQMQVKKLLSLLDSII